MSDPSESLAAQKKTLRTAALAARDALSVEQRAAAAQALASHGLPMELKRGAVVAGYAPVRSEIDPGRLMQSLAALGALAALPVIAARDQPLRFRAWSIGQPLQPGSLGIPEPSREAAELVPDILLVPLAAFDRVGHRIGYGAGYYDRTLASLRAAKTVIAVGVAFSVQEIAAVPAMQHDVALDYVLTETQMFDFRSR
jgi:5-formyltetrahydrofolate cyclo-ligase